jgi:hypothetical protein
MADEVIFLASARNDKIDDIPVLVDLLRCRRIKAKAVFVEPTPESVAA